jgi:PadR family transcriptional regulator, regulatory protein AphA
MPLAHAILASLDFQPMTGYDLKKFFDQSVGHFWTTTQSHIYKALNDLEGQGWVQKHTIPQEHKPNRKEYSITAAGRVELRHWLTAPQPPAPVREAWLIQIFFSHNSTNAEISNLIEARLKTIRQILETFKSQTESEVPQDTPPGLERAGALWQITREYGAAFYEFELRWHLEMLERVKKLPALRRK